MFQNPQRQALARSINLLDKSPELALPSMLIACKRRSSLRICKKSDQSPHLLTTSGLWRSSIRARPRVCCQQQPPMHALVTLAKPCEGCCLTCKKVVVNRPWWAAVLRISIPIASKENPCSRVRITTLEHKEGPLLRCKTCFLKVRYLRTSNGLQTLPT